MHVRLHTEMKTLHNVYRTCIHLRVFIILLFESGNMAHTQTDKDIQTDRISKKKMYYNPLGNKLRALARRVELIRSDVEIRGHMNQRAGIRWKAMVVFRVIHVVDSWT